MRHFWVTVLLSLSLVVNMTAQADSILALPEEQRMQALFNWNYLERKLGPQQIQQKLLDAAEVFRKHREDELHKWTFAFYVSALIASSPRNERENIISKHIPVIRKNGWKDLAAEYDYWLAFYRYEENRDIPSMEMMIEKVAVVERTGFSSPHTQHSIYNTLGHMAYNFGDYALTLDYLRKCRSAIIPEPNLDYDYGPLNLFGLAFERVEEYDSAIYYYKQALDLVTEHGEDDMIGVISGNIGSAYYKKGDYAQALPYLETDYHMSLERSMFGSAANASSLLANLELKRGNIGKAEEYIKFTKERIDTSSLGSMITYSENMLTYSKGKKDDKSALYYADQLQQYRKRQAKINNKEVVEQANTRVQLAQFSRDVQLLKASRSRQLLLRNALLVIFLLTGLIALLLVKRIQYIHRNNKEKLDKAQAELNRFTKSLLEKNELIQSLREQQQVMPVDTSIEDRYQTITALTHASIFTEDDWKHFRNLFDDVYPGFFAKLQEKFSDLTPAELRLLALTKLQIATKDMAEMLGISIDSIKKTKYRLRKKINLPEEGSLEELVSMI